MAKLILQDGTTYDGVSYGAPLSTAGEVVFTTGMVGYPESLTDASFAGQILIMTYPIIGNYGVPDKSLWESENIKVKGLVVSDYNENPSHFQSQRSLAKWFKEEKIPLIQIKDTRALAQKIRDKGTMLGKIIIDQDKGFYDPNKDNLVAKVSPKKIQIYTPEKFNRTIIIIDCGAKKNIIRSFLSKGIRIIHAPWDTDPFSSKFQTKLNNSPFAISSSPMFDAVFISNGPGDPKMANKTIETIKKSMENKIPTLGICLGNQLLALAAGGDTYKLKFGHRSQNQPCILKDSGRCFITTQNHGYAVGDTPSGFLPWFINANDNTIEGIMHNKHPFMAVQFHPESTPGPVDTDWIFDYFLDRVNIHG